MLSFPVSVTGTGLLPLRRLLVVACVAASLVLAVVVGVPVLADERDDAVASQEEAQRKQDELVASLEGVSTELGQAYLDLQNAQAALSTAETELSDAETTLTEKEREQQIAADRLDTAQTSLASIQEEAEASQEVASEASTSVAQIVAATYEGDNSVTSWTYVLASQDVDQLSRRAAAMEIGSGVQEAVLAAAEAERAQDANRETRQNAATERVATLKADADAAEQAAQTARDAAQTKRDEVASLEASAREATTTLEDQKADLEDQQAQARADEEEAAATIARIDEENRGTSAPPPSSSSSTDLGSGSIAHPISGSLVVASPYGYRVHPITGTSRLHAGVDLVASQGTPQYAAVSGTVTYNQNGSCGNGMFVNGGMVDGQSVVVAYCHLSAYSVGNGASVSKGDTIGLTGMTGGATGPHVHFEVYLNGVSVDPMTLAGF
ncbi:peptidoglycan DD-metalloendopeptidase family protein [Actinomyces wuliandei]|uniref:peptidoglycan DD-metalloendopeptidase family protein n=1 Tax=Actinomyces wuliandei TaxID=2057743 RepID=UPI00111A631C|nr:peptidoglycan DD-metalloendopeptidase family protein [Actinomyces wuliandei]